MCPPGQEAGRAAGAHSALAQPRLVPSPRTFNYILRELPKVPTHVPVCVLGNYRDMGEHRVILPDDVRDFIDHLNRWVPLLGPRPVPMPVLAVLWRDTEAALLEMTLLEPGEGMRCQLG